MWRRWSSVERGEASWWGSLGAGENWRRDLPEPGGGWFAFSAARTGELILFVGEPGWWPDGPFSGSPPERPSGGSPILKSRDLERALPVSRSSSLGRVEDLSLPK